MKHFDYIFTGAGLAALLVVNELIESGKFEEKLILVIDENGKKSNDRTWCFWESPNGKFDGIVTKSWKKAVVAGEDFERVMDISPLEYKMIRGLDFYNLIFEKIMRSGNVTFLNSKVIAFSDTNPHPIVTTETETFSCEKIFNSIYNPQLPLSQQKFPVLQQHFIGWFITTTTPVFTAEQATFMDFSIEQHGNTRFMYVLPISATEALVEYTLFSKDLLAENEYETAISNYIKNLRISEFNIVEKERGSIPMTGYKFWENNSENILNIGTAGGWTKASTGFTFRKSTKKAKALTSFLQTQSDLTKFEKKSRFWWYDILLLDILSKNNEKGSEIFCALFRKGNPNLIFRFLDEETTLIEDLKVIWKCPKGLFTNALVRRLFR